MEAIRWEYSKTIHGNSKGNPGLQWHAFRLGLSRAIRRGLSAYLLISTYLTIVASVAIYDICLTIQYSRSLKQMEENPIGRWLMNLDRIQENVIPDLTLFLTAKSLGTLVVLVALVTLVLRYSRIGHPVAIGVSGFQLGLAAYLTFGLNY